MSYHTCMSKEPSVSFPKWILDRWCVPVGAYPLARLWELQGPGFLAALALPGAIGHSILRTSVKPRCIPGPLSHSQDLSCFLSWVGIRRPNLITELSGWPAPDSALRTQEPVLDRRTGALPGLWQTQSDPQLVGTTDHDVGVLVCILGLTNSQIRSPTSGYNRSWCWCSGMYPRADQFPQPISLPTKKRSAQGSVNKPTSQNVWSRMNSN